MIVAVLLNPTIDEVIEISHFHVGGTFKVNRSETFPLGKAISFALSAKTLNNALINEKEVPIKVLACIGKDEIPIYNSFLDEKKIAFRFMSIDGITRSNKTIIDPRTYSVTHIRKKGFKISKSELDRFSNLVQDTTEAGDIAVFCGSIPPGVPNNIYFKMIKESQKKGVKCVLDTSGVELFEGYKAKPWMIKPNLEELASLLPDSPVIKEYIENPGNNLKNISNMSKKLLSDGTEIVITTLGRWGAICCTKEKCLYGTIIVEDPVNTVGSGDSFLGGFLIGHYLENSLEECFKWGLACGAANTLKSGAGLFTMTKVRDLYKQVEFEEIV